MSAQSIRSGSSASWHYHPMALHAVVLISINAAEFSGQTRAAFLAAAACDAFFTTFLTIFFKKQHQITVFYMAYSGSSNPHRPHKYWIFQLPWKWDSKITRSRALMNYEHFQIGL